MDRILKVIKNNMAMSRAPSICDEEDYGKMSQWTSSDGIRFFTSGHIAPTLPPGVYEIKQTQRGLMFEKLPVKTEGLINFPETNSEKVVAEIQSFWDKEDLFKKHRLAYKRGIILYGNPGTGKSCTVQLVCQDVIKRGGVVFKFNIYPAEFIEGIREFREIQSDTPLVVLLEDIDALIEMYSESEVLNILDGVENIEKVVFLATTNFPENLGSRILNRPSRFDKRFKMPPPKKVSRQLYFESILDKETIAKYEIDVPKWVNDTEGMSIAHLKELFIAVCILDDKYESAIKNLKTMNEEKLKSVEDDAGGIGFSKRNTDDDSH